MESSRVSVSSLDLCLVSLLSNGLTLTNTFDGLLWGEDVCCRIDVLAPRARSWLIDLSGSGKDAVEELGAGDAGSMEPHITMVSKQEQTRRVASFSEAALPAWQ